MPLAQLGVRKLASDSLNSGRPVIIPGSARNFSGLVGCRIPGDVHRSIGQVAAGPRPIYTAPTCRAVVTRWFHGRMHRRRGGMVALLTFVAAVVAFTWMHSRLGGDDAVALANARQLIGLERTLGVDIELGMNRWLARRAVLVTSEVYLYRLYYLPVAVTTLYLWLRHREIFVRVTRAWFVVAALALLVYWRFPVAPPRFSTPGTIDIVAAHDLLGSHPSKSVGGNLNSAFPSMHVAWCLWVAYGLHLAGSRWWPWLLPVAMAAVVLTTGNHYVLDIAASCALVGLAHIVTRPRSTGNIPVLGRE